MKARDIAVLRQRLAAAEETLRAIRNGEVDAVVVQGHQGPQVFTLEGTGHAYRVLIESMNEGALTLTADHMILYANQCFARMLKRPLDQVMGSPLKRFLPAEDWASLRPLLKRACETGSKIQVELTAGKRLKMPVQLSICPLAGRGLNRANIGMVVTDMTESRRNEERLRVLTHRVVQVQEAERGRVARELHDHITQLLCGILVRSQALANALPVRERVSRREAVKLRDMLGRAAQEVERISRNLRPGALDELGLGAVLRSTCTEFSERTTIPLTLTCAPLSESLPADTELTLYRILQEALRNAEKHAHARHVTVRVRRKPGAFVEMAIKDDGIGFDPDGHRARRGGRGCVGLLGMRERAAYAGGAMKIVSARGAGTEIHVHIPLRPDARAVEGDDR